MQQAAGGGRGLPDQEEKVPQVEVERLQAGARAAEGLAGVVVVQKVAGKQRQVYGEGQQLKETAV